MEHLLDSRIKRLQRVLRRTACCTAMGKDFAGGGAAVGGVDGGEAGEAGEEGSGDEPAAAADASVKEGGG
jgi:hypothetical protein